MQETTVANYLAERATEVSLVQLLRCFQFEHRQRLGDSQQISDQPVRLIASRESAFPVSEISNSESAFERQAASSSITGRPLRPNDQRHELVVTCFGLLGAVGAMPDHYTQLIAQRIRNKDFTLYEFFNIFNHRLVTLFYRAWEKHSFPISFETAKLASKESMTEACLRAIAQNRLSSSRDRLAFTDDALLFYAGIFASRRPSQAALQGCIEDYTGHCCEVEPLVGQWIELSVPDQTCIQTFALGQSQQNALGRDTIAGSRVWDIESRFRVRLGPVNWSTLQSYLPGSLSLRKVTDLVRRFVGAEWDFDVQVLLQSDQVKTAQLTSDEPYQLGWNTWIGDRVDEAPATEAIFMLPDFV
jgi:type VI secretion system protein ImpH